MFTNPFSRKEEDSRYDDQIDRCLGSMEQHETDSEEFAKILEHIEKFDTLDKGQKRRKLSSDALLSAGVSLLGILILVGYEHSNVITSKGINFVKKPELDLS